jgi:dipeptidyl aminopeptidase/acylaminoacyl peptidase
VLDRRSGKISVVGDFDDDVGSFQWRKDGKGLVASVVHQGRVYLNTISLEGKVSRFSAAPAGGDFALASDSGAAVVVSGMNRPPELARLEAGGKPIRLTVLNDDQYGGLDLGPAPEDLWVDAKDGARIHSFVLRPPGLAPGRRAPLLVLIHGGPQGSWEDQWGMRWNAAAFAARGAVVLAVDPRGSIGYGHAFEEQITNDWGGLAYDDILRSVDAAEKLPFVEPGRTCAAGASFGGYMIDWIAGHTDRFRCLVSHDGVFDLPSMYGSTEELWFPEWELRGPYWEQPENYRKWSPSNYVKNFHTPTLVIQGELDFRVPAEQGMGMFTALQRRGVESRLLWFPDEGHWVLKPRNSALWYHTVLDWIDAHARREAHAKK